MKRFIIAAIIIIFAVLLLPVLWQLDEKVKLQVAIIDKTVPSESFREHLGITWVLNHFGYVKKDGAAYAASEDYYGFTPNEAEQTYRIKPLPDSYDEFDFIYLADTYGVYDEDFPWVAKEREGKRSSLVYGRLEMEEWQAILERLLQQKRSTLVAEFNTFASPTDAAVRQSVSEYLQLDWSGWIGRYFKELDPIKNKEIPQWIIDDFGDEWNYKGSGFVLVNDETHKVIVLEKNEHYQGDGIKLKFTDEGKKRFGLKSSPNYQYWFDIVLPKNEENALAYYDWNLTESGKEILENLGIPLAFAGIIEAEHGNSKSYYFAGDYNDVSTVPVYYQAKSLSFLYKIFNTFSDYAFYWKTYVPVMKNILSESVEERDANTDVPPQEQVSYMSRVTDDSFEVLVGQEWKKFAIKGVNMGMGKPGAFPGEAAITEEEYYRWLVHIGDMGANSIRVYTLHPPGFYRALKRYNDEHSDPIYLFHGVWSNEEMLLDTMDAFSEENTTEFQQEMKRIVDVVHGNAVVKPQAGHASGVYSADVSNYVIGWIIGIEWDPYVVENTNHEHQSLGDYDGQFFMTTDAPAFEHWLAMQLDTIVGYEKETYNWIRPASFTNWVTTDLLSHPSEPSVKEDLVSVNPNLIHTKGDMNKVKQFASYHVYPYYPDFMNFETDYTEYVDHRGEKNNYAAYLKDLHKEHQMPVLIAEFGVPSSRGLTHENPFGWNQGFLSEQEQGEIIVRLYEDIIHEGMLGGLVFTWQDEWFKRTWNTMDYDNPDRRPFWSNAQTNEQQFGLLSFDRNKIKVDGDKSDWNDAAPLYVKQNGPLQALYMEHDERYLYLRLELDDLKNGYPVILLDTIPDQGNHSAEQLGGATFANGVDFIIPFNREEEPRILADAYYDIFTYQYGHLLHMLHPEPELPSIDSGKFKPIHYALNKELVIPKTNETTPFSSYETGLLREGNANPNSPVYDSLADYFVNEEEGVIELRLPWLLLNVKDPSHREVMGNLYKDGLEASAKIEGINLGVVMVQPSGQILDSFPEAHNGKVSEMKRYTWESWDIPQYTERLKQSYYIVKRAFSAE